MIFRGFASSTRTSQASGKVQLDALQIKFGQGNEKEVARGRVARRVDSRFFPRLGVLKQNPVSFPPGLNAGERCLAVGGRKFGGSVRRSRVDSRGSNESNEDNDDDSSTTARLSPRRPSKCYPAHHRLRVKKTKRAERGTPVCFQLRNPPASRKIRTLREYNDPFKRARLST